MKYRTEASAKRFSFSSLAGGWAVVYFVNRDRNSVFIDSIYKSARDAGERFRELKEHEGKEGVDFVAIASTWPAEADGKRV